jgi:hypothetical protein
MDFRHKNHCKDQYNKHTTHSHFVLVGTCRATMHSATISALGRHALLRPARPLHPETIKRLARKESQQTSTWAHKVKIPVTGQA